MESVDTPTASQKPTCRIVGSARKMSWCVHPSRAHLLHSLKDAFEGPEKQLGGDSTAGEQPHHHYHPHHHQNRTRHTNLHADVSELECSSHNDNDGDRDGGPAGPGVVAAGLESITDSISAGRSGGVGGVGGVGWTVGSRPTAEQELTWRYSTHYCMPRAMVRVRC